MSQPFVLFPWDRPFLEHLQDYICQTCQHDLGASLIIVPHNRPRRYLTELFRQNTLLPRPAMLPRMLTIGEMTGLFRAHAAQNSVQVGRKAALLDAVHLVYRAVQMVGAESAQKAYDDFSPMGGAQGIAQQFSQKDLASFLPWGMRLMRLFEEYMTQLIPVRDILYTEGEVSPLASALLGALGRIHTAYIGLLQQEGWTTPGLDAFLAAEAIGQNAQDLPPLLRPCVEKNAHVFVAGFSTITQCEHVLLKALWQQGAHICLHSDPQLAQWRTQKKSAEAIAEVHYSCADHITWLRQWQASCQLYMEPSGQKPQVHFMAGYDVHSQLLHMQEVLQPVAKAYAHAALTGEGTQAVPSTAVVLSSSSLLMPTLHHLPEMPFNISMGYPLANSSLFSLLEIIMRLQEGARGGAEHMDTGQDLLSARRYHWRTLLQCLRHPFVQMLQTQSEDGAEVALYALLGHMERALRKGNAFVSMQDLQRMADLQGEAPQQVRQVLQQVLPCLLENFAKVHSTYSLGEAMSALCHVLLQYGHHMWKSHPLDAESLYRLMQQVIPTLKVAHMAHEILPQKTLFSLCRELIGAERVPFEAAPLQGLQVLGMLETRLLHFDTLLILDATDDALPGFTAQDPLLPDALRKSIGLPALQERERVVAHTLHRLAASAKQVHFCWQEGMQRSELFDAKKSRSRFVDAYLWKEEQELGYILENGMHPLFSAPCPVAPMVHEPQEVEAIAAVRQKIAQLLQKGISPTKIDSYLTCPQRFVWENIYKLRPQDEVNEGDDPAAVGKLLHAVLQDVYTPWLHKEIAPDALDMTQVQDIFEAALENTAEVQALPPQSLMLLRMAAPVRLKRFLDAQAEQAPHTEVLALEQSLTAAVEGRFNQQFFITGVLDRVDTRFWQYKEEREEGLVVLDYKTGRLARNNVAIWNDTDFWTMLSLWSPTASNSAEVLQHVAQAFPSVQLPCYIYMCQQAYDDHVLDAALVDLGNSGKEMYMLGDKVDMETRADIVENRVPQLLTFILDHMYTAQSFAPREGDHCTYCPYGALCKR